MRARRDRELRERTPPQLKSAKIWRPFWHPVSNERSPFPGALRLSQTRWPAACLIVASVSGIFSSQRARDMSTQCSLMTALGHQGRFDDALGSTGLPSGAASRANEK